MHVFMSSLFVKTHGVALDIFIIFYSVMAGRPKVTLEDRVKNWDDIHSMSSSCRLLLNIFPN